MLLGLYVTWVHAFVTPLSSTVCVPPLHASVHCCKVQPDDVGSRCSCLHVVPPHCAVAVAAQYVSSRCCKCVATPAPSSLHDCGAPVGTGPCGAAVGLAVGPTVPSGHTL